ncbi:MAG: hypothetical protein JST89_17360 [Cyanobacteria bacterium SZAS-4]|nr:hypothetical protein [Cyanobacteria bacterium SZAS-4]
MQYAIYCGAIDDELLWGQDYYVGKSSLAEFEPLSTAMSGSAYETVVPRAYETATR